MKKKLFICPVCTVVSIQPMTMIASSTLTPPLNPNESTEDALSRMMGIEGFEDFENFENWGF